MGHGATRAAIIYQHATSDRDKVIADALGDLAGQVWMRPRPVADEEEDQEESGT